MFKLIQPETITWPVRVDVPVDGGRTRPATFDCEFRLGDQDWLDALVADTGDDMTFLQRVVAGWSGVQDADGEDLPYSESACAQMVGIPYVRAAMLRAFWDAVTGARAKN